MVMLYKVKIKEDEYLMSFGKVQEYTRGQALKKARMFNGKIEHSSSQTVRYSHAEFNPVFDFQGSNDGEALDEIYNIFNSNMTITSQHRVARDFLNKMREE